MVITGANMGHALTVPTLNLPGMAVFLTVFDCRQIEKIQEASLLGSDEKGFFFCTAHSKAFSTEVLPKIPLNEVGLTQ